MKLINKDHINELKKLYNDIDNCISDLVVARGRRDDNGIAAAHWQMETLMVNTQQTISYIFDTLEVKEVDLEKELKSYCKEYYNCNYPKQVEEGNCAEVMPHIVSTAKHFFELGLKHRKENKL